MGDVGSVQRSLRLPVDLAAAVEVVAVRESRSFSQAVVVLLRCELSRRGVVTVVEEPRVEAARVVLGDAGDGVGPVERMLRGLGGEDAELSAAAPPSPAVSSGRLAASSPPSPPNLDGVGPAGSHFKPYPKPGKGK